MINQRRLKKTIQTILVFTFIWLVALQKTAVGRTSSVCGELLCVYLNFRSSFCFGVCRAEKYGLSGFNARTRLE